MADNKEILWTLSQNYEKPRHALSPLVRSMSRTFKFGQDRTERAGISHKDPRVLSVLWLLVYHGCHRYWLLIKLPVTLSSFKQNMNISTDFRQNPVV